MLKNGINEIKIHKRTQSMSLPSSLTIETIHSDSNEVKSDLLSVNLLIDWANRYLCSVLLMLCFKEIGMKFIKTGNDNLKFIRWFLKRFLINLPIGNVEHRKHWKYERNFLIGIISFRFDFELIKFKLIPSSSVYYVHAEKPQPPSFTKACRCRGKWEAW